MPHIVLIVEDDPIILMTAAHTLRSAGLRTLEAETVDEAVEILNVSAPEIAAVFSDIETPGVLDGLGLAAVISEQWPEIPVVLTSGRLRPAAETLPPCAQFVAKPYDLQRVSELICDLTEPQGVANVE